MLQAIDYKTGRIRWSHRWPSGGPGVRSGLLSTAGGLLFAADTNSNLVALDATSGVALWHAALHAPMTNGPITFELGDSQYVVIGAGDTLYAFTIWCGFRGVLTKSLMPMCVFFGFTAGFEVRDG
jgi:alcohol dehydrogenase (cytochrome c)